MAPHPLPAPTLLAARASAAADLRSFSGTGLFWTLRVNGITPCAVFCSKTVSFNKRLHCLVFFFLAFLLSLPLVSSANNSPDLQITAREAVRTAASEGPPKASPGPGVQRSELPVSSLLKSTQAMPSGPGGPLGLSAAGGRRVPGLHALQVAVLRPLS